MTEVKPLRAIIYNYRKISQLDKVICPPYDIISPLQAKAYRRLSAYNMVHLTLPEAAQGRSRYQEASRLFHKWLKKGILLQDDEPAIYFCQQVYRVNKKEYSRLGFIGRLNLNSNSSIYGHEHTRVEPKEDRFKLLVKVGANLEPIFVLFSDPHWLTQSIFKKCVQPNKPFIRFKDQQKYTNVLWKLNSPDVLKKIERMMANKILFIADGHHRYEVSLSYRDMMRRKFGRACLKSKDFNSILAYFCPLQSSGLMIRPVHRLVKGITCIPMDKLKKFFYVRRSSREKIFDLLRSAPTKQRVIGMYGNKIFYIFTLKKHRYLTKIDKGYRRLDICLLNHLVLKEILGVDPEDKRRVVFSANAQDLIRQADMDNSSLVFFLKPVKISDVIYLARSGKKLPAKTTYFYPKVPSGLVIYKFAETA